MAANTYLMLDGPGNGEYFKSNIPLYPADENNPADAIMYEGNTYTIVYWGEDREVVALWESGS